MNPVALMDAHWVENVKQESQQVGESDNEGPEVMEEEDLEGDMIAGVKRVLKVIGNVIMAVAPSLK